MSSVFSEALRKLSEVHNISNFIEVLTIILSFDFKMFGEDVDKLDEIKRILNKDLLAADIKLSIFTSAAVSFKQDSLLSPFPKFYYQEESGLKDFEKLVSWCMMKLEEILSRVPLLGCRSRKDSELRRVRGSADE